MVPFTPCSLGSRGRVYLDLYEVGTLIIIICFTDEETKAQKSYLTCLYSQCSSTAEPCFQPWPSGSGALTTVCIASASLYNHPNCYFCICPCSPVFSSSQSDLLKTHKWYHDSKLSNSFSSILEYNLNKLLSMSHKALHDLAPDHISRLTPNKLLPAHSAPTTLAFCFPKVMPSLFLPQSLCTYYSFCFCFILGPDPPVSLLLTSFRNLLKHHLLQRGFPGISHKIAPYPHLLFSIPLSSFVFFQGA